MQGNSSNHVNGGHEQGHEEDGDVSKLLAGLLVIDDRSRSANAVEVENRQTPPWLVGMMSQNSRPLSGDVLYSSTQATTARLSTLSTRHIAVFSNLIRIFYLLFLTCRHSTAGNSTQSCFIRGAQLKRTPHGTVHALLDYYRAMHVVQSAVSRVVHVSVSNVCP